MAVDVRRAGRRFVTRQSGRTTAHSFSFGAHYDPTNTGFGALLAHNDERLPPGTGYDDHHHAGVEIVTVVLAGSLRHRSDVGSAVLGVGDVARLSAGAGVTHAETADDPVGGVRFVQCWLRAHQPDSAPSYEWDAAPSGPGLMPLVGGDSSVGLGADARLLRGSLGPGEELTLPSAHRMHLFVLAGTLRTSVHTLAPDDAARFSDESGVSVASDSSAGGQFLLWVV